MRRIHPLIGFSSRLERDLEAVLKGWATILSVLCKHILHCHQHIGTYGLHRWIYKEAFVLFLSFLHHQQHSFTTLATSTIILSLHSNYYHYTLPVYHSPSHHFRQSIPTVQDIVSPKYLQSPIKMQFSFATIAGPDPLYFPRSTYQGLPGFHPGGEALRTRLLRRPRRPVPEERERRRR